MSESSSSPSSSPSSPSSSSAPTEGKGSAPSPSPVTLRSAIKSTVDVTNSTLSSLERHTDDASQAFVSRLGSLGRQFRHYATRAALAYDNRGRYGPQVVAGSALAFGGLIAMRRGRVPGAFAGAMAGGAAYANVYGVGRNAGPSYGGAARPQ